MLLRVGRECNMLLRPFLSANQLADGHNLNHASSLLGFELLERCGEVDGLRGEADAEIAVLSV